MKLYAAAKYSSEGGKLSFWNCTIIAPDGKEFIIGINQDLLLKLLKACTIIKGEIQEQVWLGREGGNRVGAYTETMEDFAQALKDKQARSDMKTKTTTTYKPGDIVETLTSKELYVGEVYEYFTYERIGSNYYGNEYIVQVYKTPKKLHVFKNVHKGYDWSTHTTLEEEVVSDRWDLKAKKPKRIITTQTSPQQSLEECYAQQVQDKDQNNSNYYYYHDRNEVTRLQYSIELRQDKLDLSKVEKALFAYVKHNHYGSYANSIKITFEEAD